ncbi:phosphatidylserine synthase [Pseudomonas aeruginosa PA38182]|nr:phosphatidylserine synthase [Pseudomonas aeruginosa PA38182]
MSERPEEPNKASDEESLLPIDEHIEEGHDAEGRKVRHRGIYLLPNLFTTAALFSGFYAIINGMSGQFANAAIAIFVAMVLDGLDGRVARLTNTQSAFGAEYDSLSDMVAFGVAPALVASNGRLAASARSAGWSPSSTLRAPPCVWLVSTPRSARPTSAISSAWPVRPPRRWWRARYGRSAISRSRAPRLPSSSPCWSPPPVC